MKRRSFLGTVLGLITVVALPKEFLALSGDEPWQRVIEPYHLLFRDKVNGVTLQAPGIKGVFVGVNQCSFVAENMLMKADIEITSTVLLDLQGRVIDECIMPMPVRCVVGDQVACQYMMLKKPQWTLEEAINLTMTGKGGVKNIQMYTDGLTGHEYQKYMANLDLERRG